MNIDKQITIKNNEGYFSCIDTKTDELIFTKDIRNGMFFYEIDELFNYLGQSEQFLEKHSPFEVVEVIWFEHKSEWLS